MAKSKEEVSSVRKLFAIVFSLLPLLALTQAAPQTPSVVAVVNGEEITKPELDQLTNIPGIVFSLYQQYPRFAQVLLTTEEGKALLKVYEREVLEGMIKWRLLVQEARARGLTVPEEELEAKVDATIQGILQRNQLTEDRLAEILKAQRGQTLEEFRAQIRREIEERMLIDLLKDSVTADVSVAKEEIEAYYEEHRDSFTDEEGNIKPLDEVGGEILTALMNQKKDAYWKEFVEKLRQEAEIEIYL
jgi:peptidyl-prolyl cis-trans isomerase C/foldase protein PrsA